MWLWTFLSIVFFNVRWSSRVFNEVSGGFHWPQLPLQDCLGNFFFSFLHVLIYLKMSRWKESQPKTYVAGQHLCLPHIWCQTTAQTAVRVSGQVIFTDLPRHPGSSSDHQWASGPRSGSRDSEPANWNPPVDIIALRNYQEQQAWPPESCWDIVFVNNKFLPDFHKPTSRSASSLFLHQRSFLWPFEPSLSVSSWTKGSTSAERDCVVLAGVERAFVVCCSPSVSAHFLWSAPEGLRNRAQPDQERRQRTSEPQTLG